MTLPAPFLSRPAELWTLEAAGPAMRPAERPLPEEVPVALTYGRETQAVMMASPQDLEDFALGFSLTEGIVADRGEILELEVIARPQGIELRMEIAPERQEALRARRRRMAGPVGCGLCGLDSLEAVMRPVPPVADGGLGLEAGAVRAALEALSAGQVLHDATRAAHAAGFWAEGRGLACLREDVGRHNALDKVVGAVRRMGLDPARGAVVLTSRVSVELVQKTALLGAPLLIAVSAPTGLAVRTAEAAGITLIARARGDRFEVHTHPRRILARG